jgi:hypothetical protein
MYNPRKAWWLKVGLLIAISAINVSVFCIWIPARLQINPTFIHINTVWDRVEKVLFAVIDVSMNTYFMWLVKSKLVSGGLKQYNLVYKYNLAMVCVSLSLDVSKHFPCPHIQVSFLADIQLCCLLGLAHRPHVAAGRRSVSTCLAPVSYAH